MKSSLYPLRRKYMENHLITTKLQSKQQRDKIHEENTIEWITFYRRNWHIYVDRILGIKLRPFQMIMIYLMGISENFYGICSRGLSDIAISNNCNICLNKKFKNLILCIAWNKQSIDSLF